MNPQTISPNITPQGKYIPYKNSFSPLIVPKNESEQIKQFASALAHEVRNPLSNINLAVEMLKSAHKEIDQTVYLDIINRSSARVNELIIHFLRSFKEEEKQAEKCSVHQLIDEVLALNRDRIMLNNIIIKKDYTAIDCKIFVNKQKLKIAFSNIIMNAIEAMQTNRGKLTFVTKSIHGKCVLEIEDNGTGISEEHLKDIFKPYFTNKPGGMGLGLSTTLDTLLSNQAQVDVQSELDRGTRFIISFDGIHDFRKCYI